MILHCDFEELAALAAATGRTLEAAGHQPAVTAPPQAIVELEALLPRLVGDIAIDTLAEQSSLRRAIAFLTDELRARLDRIILEQHPAAEDAVLAYFEYARVLTVLERLDRIGHDMAALVELLTGEPAGAESTQHMSFPQD
ncbi:MAG: hypothetical protein FIB01_02185 [Gemmatimonadetes bacterium]|nr:hypothetical protein [Gemmatimonadota bacterium]